MYYTITARLWYNRPIRTEQILDLRMCEDILIYNKRSAFIIAHHQGQNKYLSDTVDIQVNV